MRGPSRGEQGTTVVELVVASTLLLLVLGLAVPVIVGSHTTANRVVAISQLHADGRAVLDEAVRRLRAARPVGVCLDPPGAAVASCLRLGSAQAPILQATANRVCFASMPNALTADVDAVLPAPDLVCIARDPGTELVTVETRRPKRIADCVPGTSPTVSYTTPCWDHASTGRSLAVGRAVGGSPSLLSYADVSGSAILPPGPMTLDDGTDDDVLAPRCPGTPCVATMLAAIATIRLDVRLGMRIAGRVRTSDIHVAVSPRGSRYGREQTWSA